MLALALIVALASPEEDLARAKAQWHAMKLDAAASTLKKLVERHELSPEVDVEARVLLGVTFTELGQFKEAEAAFVSALERNRDATLPDLEAHGAPPRVRGLWEAAKLKVDPPPPPSVIARPAPAATARAPSPVDDRPLPEPGVVERVPPAPPPWLLIGAGAVGGAGVVLAGTAAAIDVAAGPEMFDGGTGSFLLLGASAALLVTAGSLAVVDVVASR